MSDRWFLVSGSCVQRLQAPTMCLLVLWRWVQLLQHPIGQALTRLRSFLSQQPARTRATKQLRGILHTTRMIVTRRSKFEVAGNQGKCKVSEVHLCGHRQLEQNFGHPRLVLNPLFEILHPLIRYRYHLISYTTVLITSFWQTDNVPFCFEHRLLPPC